MFIMVSLGYCVGEQDCAAAQFYVVQLCLSCHPYVDTFVLKNNHYAKGDVYYLFYLFYSQQYFEA